MPELYIGNMSKQIIQFAYRSPERPGVITQIIPIGGQIRVSPNGVHTNLSTPEIDAIIGQHRAYGIVDIAEVDKAQSPFNSTCYSIGKQISVDKLRKAMLKKEEALQAFGRKLRQEAALAVNSQIEESAGGPIRELQMSFEEVEPKGGYVDDTDHVAEGVLVTRSAQPGAPTPINIGTRRR